MIVEAYSRFHYEDVRASAMRCRYFTIFLIVGGKRGGLEGEIQFPRPHLVFHFYSVPFHGTFQKCDCVR